MFEAINNSELRIKILNRRKIRNVLLKKKFINLCLINLQSKLILSFLNYMNHYHPIIHPFILQYQEKIFIIFEEKIKIYKAIQQQFCNREYHEDNTNKQSY